MTEEKREYYLATTEKDKQLLKLFRIQVNHSGTLKPVLLYINDTSGFLTDENDYKSVLEGLLERGYSKMTKETLNRHILEMSLGISKLW